MYYGLLSQILHQNYFSNKNTALSIKISLCLIFSASSYKLCHITLICKDLKISFEGGKMTAIPKSRRESRSLATSYGFYT